MHLSQIENHVVLLDLPIEGEAIRNLEESFIVVWQLVRGILFFPFRDGYFSNTLTLSEFYV